MEESRLREDNFEYDEEEANKVLHQEQMNQKWESMCVPDEDSDDESS